MSKCYRFGQYSLDAHERRLSRDGDSIRLEPKSFDVLHLLLENAGHLVSKQTIADTVWAGVAVTDNSLTQCIHQIRGVLDDRADAPRFIETVAGSGYRFIASVECIDSLDSAGSPRPRDPQKFTTSWHIALLTLTAVVAVAAFWAMTRMPESDPAPIRRVAVLPFENLTGNPEQEYFVQGVHEALIAELSRVGLIDVISRTSVMQFRETDLAVPAIAQQLDVDAVIEGSVLRAGDNLTVTAQLIATQPERHLWANRYHRRVSELFEITTDITNAIANEIAVELTPEERNLLGEASRIDAAAYDDYLQAQFHFARRTPDSYRKAQALYSSAIEKDPNLAPAYAGLAHSYGSAAIFGLIEPAAGMPRARELAEQALKIDGDVTEAHLILAGVAFYYDWDRQAAQSRIAHALRINPNSAHAYRLLSEVYSTEGRHTDALAAVERARALDPLVATSQFKPALILYLARDYAAAAERVNAALEYFPEYWPGHWLHCLVLSAQGQQDEAVQACETAVTYARREPMALGMLGHVNALAGRDSTALRIAGELEAMMQERYVSRAALAIIYAALDQPERALDLLDYAYRHRDQLLVHDDNATFLDPLRSDKRFIAFLQNPPPSQEIN